MTNPVAKLRVKYAKKVLERYDFIEFCLFWRGSISRSDVKAKFDLSDPQASADISRYKKEINPQGLMYDTQKQAYQALPSFKTILTTPNPREYLNELRMSVDDIRGKEALWLPHLPPFDTIMPFRRMMAPETLRSVIRAIEENQALLIRYQSLTHGTPVLRWMSPHAIGFDGFRWHARGVCHLRRGIRDFVFGRIIAVEDVQESQSFRDLDEAWNTIVDLRVEAASDLTPSQKSAVEYEFGMEGGGFTRQIRLSMANYYHRLFQMTNAVDEIPSVELPNIQMLIDDRDAAEERSNQLINSESHPSLECGFD